MPYNKTILAHQLPGLSRTQTRDTRPVVASDSHVESFLFKSSVAVQMLVIGFWVGSWAVLLKVPIPLSQTRGSFFPYRVRETWKYEYLSHPLVAGQIVSMVLTRDSIRADGNHCCKGCVEERLLLYCLRCVQTGDDL